MRVWKSAIVGLLFDALILMPILPAFPITVQAADQTEAEKRVESCKATFTTGTDSSSDEGWNDEEVPLSAGSTEATVSEDSEDGTSPDAPVVTDDSSTYGNFSIIRYDTVQSNIFYNKDIFKEQMSSYLNRYVGFYSEENNGWVFCTSKFFEVGFTAAPITPDTGVYLDTLKYPVDKLVFQNELDRYALTGEPCTLFDNNKKCKTDSTSTPVYYDDGTTPKLDADGKPVTVQKPTYYKEIWQNGVWDAPKADSRILELLVYLVTPVDQGGAGREHIKVGKIIQTSKSDKEFAAMTVSTAEGDTSTDTTTDNDSSHYYDMDHPSAPERLARAVDITEIDSLRVTTKIVQKRRLGGNTTSYKYKDIPIKVSYQTSTGSESAPLVNSDIYDSSLSSFSSSLAGLLDQMNLGAEIDLDSVDVTDLGDLAELIGSSLLTTLLNSPNLSLKGWDFKSLVDSIGRAYIAQQLGLKARALSEGNSTDDILANIGRVQVEDQLGLPAGSLKGNTSPEIWANIGRRYMEDKLGVSDGTLSGGKELDYSTFLERVGAGKIEKRFSLKNGSVLAATSWDTFAGSKAPVKMQYLFKNDVAAFVDDALDLAYQSDSSKPSGQNSCGFSEGDYGTPTQDAIASKSNASLSKYKQLVGCRAIESTLGKFTSQAAKASDWASAEPQESNFLDVIKATFRFRVPTNVADRVLQPGESVLVNEYRGAPIYVGEAGLSYVSNGFLTRDELVSLATSMVEDSSRNTFRTTIALPAQQLMKYIEDNVDLYNYLNTQYITPIQQALTNINMKQSLVTATTSTESNLTSTDLLNSQQAISTLLGTMKQYAGGLVTDLKSVGQSGQAAALDIAGALYTVDQATNNLTKNKVFDGDAVAAFLKGNISSSVTMAIGRIIIGKKSSNDNLNQYIIAGQLNQDTSYQFTSVASGVADLQSWVSAGLKQEDFFRIFQKDLGRETFIRIGKTELLRTAWNKSELKTAASNALGQIDTSEVDQALNEIKQGVDFYTTRLTTLQSTGDKLKAKLEELKSKYAWAEPALNGIKDATEKSKGIIQTISNIQKVAEAYEKAFDTVNAQQDAAELQTIALEGLNAIQEIIAGHSLSFNQSASSGTSGSSNQKSGCFTQAGIRLFFTSKTSNFTDMVATVAGCQIDDSLSLPYGSMYNWYKTNDYTYDNLTLSIGQAYAKNGKISLTDSEAQNYGKKILEGAAVASIIGSIPGFRNQGSGSVVITGEDIVSLFSGNTEKALMKIGGNMMDSYFNWERGTASTIISPQCFNVTTKESVTCDRKTAEGKRLTALAKLGLKEIGVDLNFPTGFDITAKGDILQNFGAAQLSDDLGLSSGSFTGLLSSMVASGKNSNETLLQAFGWNPTYFSKQLDKLRDTLLMYSSTSTSRMNFYSGADLAGIASYVIERTNALNKQIIDYISNPNSQVWAATTSIYGTANLAIAGQELFDAQFNEYYLILADVMLKISSATFLDSSVKSSVYKVVNELELDMVNKGVESWIKQRTTEFFNQLFNFVMRVQQLDKTYCSGADTKTCSFKLFLTNQIPAENIGKYSAYNKLNNILGDQLDKALEGTPFEGINKTFRTLTKTDDCPSGINLHDFFLGFGTGSVFNSTPEGCKSKTLVNTSLDDIFNGTGTNAQIKRAYLYDFFLARSWGMKFEQDLGLESGTLRAIAMQPWRAKEIAIDQGIRILGAQLLDLSPQSIDANENEDQKVYRNFRESILAGFCPVNPNIPLTDAEKPLVKTNQMACTLDFNKTRALVNFKYDLASIVQQRFSGSQRESTDLGLADLALALTGGLQGIVFDAAARFATEMNKEIGNDARAQAFKITYADVRNAYGSFLIPVSDTKFDVASAKAIWIVNNFGDACETGDCTPEEYVNWYNNLPYISDAEKQKSMDEAVAQGKKDALSYMKKRAQERLQYKMYDIVAFKLDQNIPAGFTYAMVKGNRTAKTLALGTYVLNTINFSQEVFGGAITNEQAMKLGTYAASCFKSGGKGVCDAKLVDMTALGALDNWFSQQSEKLLGFNLPSGTVQGIFAWGTTGFKGSAFDSAGVDGKGYLVGNQYFPPVGTVLKTWGTQQLLSWGDKELGFDAGSLYSMYSAAKDLADASNYLRALKTDLLSDLSWLDSEEGVNHALDELNAADEKIAAARATLYALVINTVFKSQISDAEKALGLVPGTGSMAVGILTQIACSPTNAIPWVGIGLFVLMNLVGVYSVEITVRATGDGYYPYTGHFGTARSNPLETVSPDPQYLEFDAKNTESYRAGIKSTAQYKVNQLLQDILTFPQKWGTTTGQDPYRLWVAQIFTARKDDVDSLDYLISQPAPYSNPKGLGYGKLSDRALITTDATTKAQTVTQKSGVYSGVFYDPSCAENGSSTSTSTSSSGTSSSSSSSTNNTSSSSSQATQKCAFGNHIHLRW